VIDLADPMPLPERPRLPGTVVLRATADEVLDAAAAELLIQANNCVRAFGDFHLAIGMGAGAEPLLRRLMYDPACRDLPWKRTHLWLVDDVRLPDDDNRRASAALRELVVEPSDIPVEQTHLIDPMRSDADSAYEATLRECLGWREKGHDRLDYVLLGLGPGPGDLIGELEESDPPNGAERRLVRTLAGHAGAVLVTMTLPLVRAARLVAVVGLGPECRPGVAAAVQATGQRPSVPDAARHFPRAGILPTGGELRWYLDSAACPPAGTP
jgi:6-phosphogluconolactonase/glucosamine-6-phosphate isomerase/deaminase